MRLSYKDLEKEYQEDIESNRDLVLNFLFEYIKRFGTNIVKNSFLMISSSGTHSVVGHVPYITVVSSLKDDFNFYSEELKKYGYRLNINDKGNFYIDEYKKTIFEVILDAWHNFIS